MPEVSVVLDTHILIEAILRLNHEYQRAYNLMIERHHKLLMSNRILEQYQTIIHKHYNLPATFIIKRLQELEDIHHIVKKVRKGDIKSVSITDLQTNDRPFVELACNRAKFLVTNDPHFHKGKRPREFRDKCRFAVKYAEDYAEIEE